MKITQLAFAAAFTLIFATPLAKASPVNKSPFNNCWMQSGPQLREEALQIPNELLQDNWRKLNDPSKGQVTTTTYFRLNIDPKTLKLSLGEDQSFNDMANTDSEVIVQVGGSAFLHDGSLYGAIETQFGSAYTRADTRSTAGIAFGEIYLQYVSYAKDGYRDLRLHCSYQE